jgi:hypothetical protein
MGNLGGFDGNMGRGVFIWDLLWCQAGSANEEALK